MKAEVTHLGKVRKSFADVKFETRMKTRNSSEGRVRPDQGEEVKHEEL